MAQRSAIVAIFSRHGHDFTERFASIARLLRELPAKAVVLDGEIVANDALGRPDFIRLQMRWPGAVHLSAFDLLAFNGRDLRPQPLVKRQGCLQALLARFDCPAVSLSEPFEEGLAMLRVAEARGLEGVVSKRRSAPYRSGECRDWRKVKTVELRSQRPRTFLIVTESRPGTGGATKCVALRVRVWCCEEKQSETTSVRYCTNIPRTPRPERGTFIPRTRSWLA